MEYDPLSPGIFFERARKEAQRYGEDSWVFLRELVQNSRDAGATRIAFHTGTDEKHEWVSCWDNGSGMDREEIENFLLRLYASSKEQQQNAVGFFGVGFWSVLLFGPSVVRVRSRRAYATHAFEIHCATREIRALQAPLSQIGTEITLIRPVGSPSADRNIASVVREKLIYYAGHLRPLKGGVTLELRCDKEKLNRDFQLPPQMGKRLKTKDFQGVIGFGPRPSVKIYKGGILVMDLASLAEIIPSRVSKWRVANRGLYPVIAVNVDGLDLLMDRHTAYQDVLLHKVVDTCEKEVFQLHRQLIRRIFPMDFKNKWFLWRQHPPKFLFRTALGAGFILLMLLSYYAGMQFSTRGEAPALPIILTTPRFPVESILQDWQGAVIEKPNSASYEWDFQYEGPPFLLFKIRSLSLYDPEKGLVPEPRHRLVEPRYTETTDATIVVQLGLTGKRELVPIPLPLGYGLIRETLHLEGGAAPPVYQNQHGEVLAKSLRPGRISYQAAPHGDVMYRPTSSDRPGLTWPADLQRLLSRSLGRETRQKVSLLANWLQRHFIYSQSDYHANLFENAPGPWLQKAMEVRAGDCDVLNGILVLLLREAGVTAYLDVGLVGRDGRAHPALHAWVRYFDDGWRVFDITHHTARLPGSDVASVIPRARPTAEGPPPTTAVDQPAPPTATAEMPLDPWATTMGKHWFWLLPLPLLLLLFFRFRKRDPPTDAPRYISQLFQHYYQYGAQSDPLQLRFRPLFSLIGKKRISLFEVQQRANRNRLWGAYPNCQLLTSLRNAHAVLDRSHPMVRLLRPFLPTIPWLDEMDFVAKTPSLEPLFRPLVAKIQEIDPTFRLHIPPGNCRFHEVYLPLRKPEGGARHVILGQDHPLYREMRLLLSSGSPMGLFNAVALLMERMTFYLNEKERFLAAFARQIGNRAKPNSYSGGRSTP